MHTVNIAIAYLDSAAKTKQKTKKKTQRTCRLFLPFDLQIGLALAARKGWIKIFDRFCYCLDIAHGKMLHRQRHNIRQTLFQLEQTVIRHNLN